MTSPSDRRSAVVRSSLRPHITTFITWQATSLGRAASTRSNAICLKAKETELLNLTNLARSAIEDVYAGRCER